MIPYVSAVFIFKFTKESCTWPLPAPLTGPLQLVVQVNNPEFQRSGFRFLNDNLTSLVPIQHRKIYTLLI